MKNTDGALASQLKGVGSTLRAQMLRQHLSVMELSRLMGSSATRGGGKRTTVAKYLEGRGDSLAYYRELADHLGMDISLELRPRTR